MSVYQASYFELPLEKQGQIIWNISISPSQIRRFSSIWTSVICLYLKVYNLVTESVYDIVRIIDVKGSCIITSFKGTIGHHSRQTFHSWILVILKEEVKVAVPSVPNILQAGGSGWSTGVSWLPQTYTGLFVNDMNSLIGLKIKVFNSTREWEVVE